MFTADYDITLTCQDFFEHAKKVFPALRIYTFNQFTAEKRYGGNESEGKSAVIYIKGMGIHFCGYFHSSKTHYSTVGCYSVGGHAKRSAHPKHWAGSISWYLPLVSTRQTYYSYGYE